MVPVCTQKMPCMPVLERVESWGQSPCVSTSPFIQLGCAEYNSLDNKQKLSLYFLFYFIVVSWDLLSD